MTVPGQEGPPPWRIWLAIGLGTCVQIIAFGSILVGTLASTSDQELAAGPAFALGFGLVPFVFVVVAFVSAKPRAPLAILKGMGLWLLFTLPLGLINPVTGLCAGFCAAGAVCLRRPERSIRWSRSIASALAVVYVTALVIALPEAGIFAGAVTPLIAIRIADNLGNRKTSRVDGS